MLKNMLLGSFIAGTTLVVHPALGQTKTIESISAEAKAKVDAEIENKAAQWVSSLNLNDKAKESRLNQVIVTHLNAVRDWHNAHPSSTVPEGMNPVTGIKLSDLDRQFIADSAMPSSVHSSLMSGLRADLKEEQVEAILDQYTIGKVAFTMKAYKEIVPNLTAQEEATLLNNLKLAREQAVDFKSMKLISMVFEIYKTKNEQFLNSNGRSWKQMYSDYTKALKAKKAAEQERQKVKAER